MTPSELGLKYLLWGLVFIMNPDINIIDILPDFIGCLFIMKGLYNISQIYPQFNDSLENFRKFAIISVLKTVSLPVLFIISASEITWLLLLSFVFGCLEIFYGLVSFSTLFEGFYYSAERGAGVSVFNGYDKIKTFTLIFICFKPLAAFLPEMTSLSSEDYGTVTDTGIVSFAKLRLPLMAIFFVIALAVGIVWYIFTRKYLKKVLSDEEYILSLCEKYYSYKENSPQLVERRVVLSALMLFLAAAVCSIEIKLDGINYIPHMLGAFFFILAFSKVKKIFGKGAKAGIVLSYLYFALSSVSWGFSFFFTKKYIVSSSTEVGLALGYGQQIAAYLGSNEEITNSFTIMCVLYVIESLAFVSVLVLAGKILAKMLIRHGGKPIYELGQCHDMKVILRSTAVERLWITLTVVLGTASAILGACQLIFVTAEINLWIFDFALRICWAVIFVFACDKIKESVKEKYIYLKADEKDL
ncbi:MAG: hypothetical protein E7633_09090 [Ruminococcaceae bacterium]|nr:hypothetical protein [Oscillospiraceae bacterium]